MNPETSAIERLVAGSTSRMSDEKKDTPEREREKLEQRERGEDDEPRKDPEAESLLEGVPASEANRPTG